MHAIENAGQEDSDRENQHSEMESPYLNPAKSGRTVPYSPSKEHMSATIESHGTSPEKPRQSILKGTDRKR